MVSILPGRKYCDTLEKTLLTTYINYLLGGSNTHFGAFRKRAEKSTLFDGFGRMYGRSISRGRVAVAFVK